MLSFRNFPNCLNKYSRINYERTEFIGVTKKKLNILRSAKHFRKVTYSLENSCFPEAGYSTTVTNCLYSYQFFIQYETDDR